MIRTFCWQPWTLSFAQDGVFLLGRDPARLREIEPSQNSSSQSYNGYWKHGTVQDDSWQWRDYKESLELSGIDGLRDCTGRGWDNRGCYGTNFAREERCTVPHVTRLTYRPPTCMQLRPIGDTPGSQSIPQRIYKVTVGLAGAKIEPKREEPLLSRGRSIGTVFLAPAILPGG